MNKEKSVQVILTAHLSSFIIELESKFIYTVFSNAVLPNSHCVARNKSSDVCLKFAARIIEDLPETKP